MKKAFTLAEVLAALAIVGVIASVTVPTLQAGYQDRKYQALTKKAHLTLQQAIEATMLDDNIRKARSGMGLVYWLAATNVGIYTKDEPSLRTIASSMHFPGSWQASVKMTDGMIIQDGGTCHSCATNNVCTIYVDVDGASGPTASTHETKLSTFKDSGVATDIMVFQCRNNNIMPPLRDTADPDADNSEAANRTRVHLSIEED